MSSPSISVAHILDYIQNMDAFIDSVHAEFPEQTINKIYIHNEKMVSNTDEVVHLSCEFSSGETTVISMVTSTGKVTDA